MSKKGLEAQRNYPLNKKVSEYFWGGWCMQALWNYERQMNTAFMWGMHKTLDRLYPDKEEIEKKKERYNASLEFFNITPQLGAFVLGLAGAMEEEYAENPDTFDPKMITSIKTALMGPLSGIGDSLFQGTIRIIAMLISIATSFPITWYGAKLGYTKGKEFIQQIAKSNLFDKVMYGCSVAGLMVIGGMTASLVNITTPLQYGDTLVVQNLLDGILPKMIPLALTFLMYKIVKKGIHPIWIVLICFIAGIALNYFGILAVA